MYDTFPFAGVLFDLDGTLLDSMGVWTQIDIDFLHRRGLEVPPDYSEKLAPLTFRETAEYTIARFALKETPEAIMDEWNQMALEAYTYHVPLKPGSRAFLERLRAQNIPLGICTALSPELYLPALEHHGILAYFSAIVTTDQVQKAKTFPEPFLAGAQALGILPADCLVLEDTPGAVCGALAAGMTVWGIRDDPKCTPELERLCHAVFDDFTQMPF